MLRQFAFSLVILALTSFLVVAAGCLALTTGTKGSPLWLLLIPVWWINMIAGLSIVIRVFKLGREGIMLQEAPLSDRQMVDEITKDWMIVSGQIRKNW